MLNAFMVLAVSVALLLRWCVSLHNYSGHNKPPMFGDYEAQRHWMEITLRLPVEDWYTNTTDNDLMYWGLDYPPLTAYHSLLSGYVSSFIDVNFTALNTSRGFESYEHKLYMRSTVIVADILVFIPAILWYFSIGLLKKQEQKLSGNVEESKTQVSMLNIPSLSVYLALIYPGLIIIDHGHFQYNNVSLGLFVAAVTAVTRGWHLVGSCLYCLALNYKQMELYHALPFFCYLLGLCLPRKGTQTFHNGFMKLLQIGIIVVATFIIVWFPFLKSFDLMAQVILRLFPLARGVFEDKVANIWCAINVVYKLRNSFSNESMARLCLLTTFLAVLPSSLDLLFRPTVAKFRLALINSSLAFFLFSFQVHEKSILLVAIPVILYFSHDTLPSYWFLLISVFSMLPLLQKDELLIPTLALVLFYSVSVHLTVDFPMKPKSQTGSKSQTESVSILWWLFYLSMTGCAVLAVSLVVLQPPAKYPDIFPLLISVYSCIHFCGFFIYFNTQQIFLSVFHCKLKSS